MAGPFKMKGSALYGKGNQSPKSKDPIGDWFRKAGSQVKGDIEKVIGGTRKVAKTVKRNVRSAVGQAGTDLGNIKKNVEYKARKVTGDIEKSVRSVVSKLPKSKKSETHKKVLKNKFNPSSGWKWVKK